MDTGALKNKIIELTNKKEPFLLIVKGYHNSGKTHLALSLVDAVDYIVYHSGTHPNYRNEEMIFLSNMLRLFKEDCLIVLDECYSDVFIENTCFQNRKQLVVLTNNKYLTVNTNDYINVFEYSIENHIDISAASSIEKDPTTLKTRIIVKNKASKFEIRIDYASNKCFRELVVV